MIKMSRPGKMPCKSWSLQAGKTCPGSIDSKTKNVIDVCSGCYAKSGTYTYKEVIALREYNFNDWKRDDFVSDFVNELDTERHFRWFDSGDIYHPILAAKIYEIMLLTPWVKHWLPTKSYEIKKIRFWLDKMAKLPNVSIRFSSPSILGEFNSEHGSTVIPAFDFETKADHVCDAYERNGKCGLCRVCWNKEIKTVAYVAHGFVMKSKVKKKLAA